MHREFQTQVIHSRRALTSSHERNCWVALPKPRRPARFANSYSAVVCFGASRASHQAMVSAKRAIGILAPALAFGGLIQAEDERDLLTSLPKEVRQEEIERNTAAPCLQPPSLLVWQDYQGPFKNVVSAFAGNLGRESAHPLHYKPDAVLCSLMLKDKLMLFVRDTENPISYLSSAFNAALDHATNQDPTFGKGSAGYAKRFRTDFASQTTARFLMDFAYPAIFSEDPRYYRLGRGRPRTRLFHAVEHTFVAHRDNGARMVNFTEWLGTTTAVVVNHAYHSGNERGFGPTAQEVGYSVGMNMGFDVLREFWPEISHKLKMPFRDRDQQK